MEIMVGLDSPEFLKAVQENFAQLVCSEVSAALLLALPSYCHLKPFVRWLSCNLQAIIDLSPTVRITVTLNNAGNCLGFVMFNYESVSKSVLYTQETAGSRKTTPNE